MRSLCILAFVLGALLCQAQGPGSGLASDAAIVEYSARFNADFERGRNLLDFRSVLICTERFSDFYMLPVADRQESPAEFEILLDVDTMFRVVKDLEASAVFFTDLGLDGRSRYYKDSLYPMVWTLRNETKRIDGIECHMAVTGFRGRSYTAWYAPSIPLGNGPWKLGGLPGLVIEAYEDSHDLHFQLSSIRFLPHQEVPSPSALHRVGMPDYESFKSYWRESIRILEGAMGARENPDCISCHTNTKVKVYSWEKVR